MILKDYVGRVVKLIGEAPEVLHTVVGYNNIKGYLIITHEDGWTPIDSVFGDQILIKCSTYKYATKEDVIIWM